MKPIKPVIHACFALSLAACGGGDLSIGLPGETPPQTLKLVFHPEQAVEHPLPFRISGGVPPYISSIDGCPDWVTLFPDQGILAGTAPSSEHGRSFFCTYVVTDSATFSDPQTKSFGLHLAVVSLTAPVLPSIDDQTLNIGFFHSVTFPTASSGLPPYTYALTCAGGMLPSGMGFAPETRVFAGTPNALFRDSCTYTVTESAQPAATVSRAIEVIVEPLERGRWRFRTRTVEPTDLCFTPTTTGMPTAIEVATLPHAQGGDVGQAVYDLIDFPSGHYLVFTANTRQLTYTNPSTLPILGTPNTYRYLAGAAGVNAENADDALCLDVQFRAGVSDPECPDEEHVKIQLRVRDDAFWDENAGTAGEFRCPDTTAPTPRSAAQSVSNPVHTALAPVHARRAIDVAHAAVRDRVRGWSPGAPRDVAISPSVDFASLSGLSGGFDYAGSSRSLSGGVELGADSWQAGLVAAFTRTDLRYRAGADLSRLGYRAGEHDTEIFSVHPFAAWHAPSGGHLWASLGAGLGDLRHRDDLGFPSWSSSDVRLRAYAVGASVPLADVLSGDLDAEAGIESFAFEIKGGGRISTSLPTLHGRDYRAGLAWNAPVRGAPFVSLAYRQVTGDGPEGAQVEAQGSVSAAGIHDPRLTLTANAEAAFGLGDYDRDSWRLGGGIHFAPDISGRGFGLDLDTRLMSPGEGRSAGIGVRGEAGYGLWSKSLFGVVRPYFGLIRYPGDGATRRIAGLNLRDTSTSQVKVEVYDHDRDRSPTFKFTSRHRF